MLIGRFPWLLLGLLSAALGLIGFVLPLLPTTPFLLLSAFGFSRLSPRLHAWLIHHPRLGPPLRDWQVHRAYSRRATAFAVGAITATFTISLVIGVNAPVLGMQALVLSAAAAFILTRSSASAL